MSLPVPFPLAAAKTRGDRARARRALVNQAVAYGVLWSCSSEAVYEDLVDGPFASRAETAALMGRITSIQGIQAEMVFRVPDLDDPDQTTWLTQDGYTPSEALAAFRESWRFGAVAEPSPRLARYTQPAVSAEVIV